MKIIVVAIQLLCAAACIHYALSSRFFPMRIAYEPYRELPWWAWLYYGFLVLGYGGMLYAAGRWLTKDLPSFMQEAVGVAAFFGALFVIDAFGELGHLTLSERKRRAQGASQ